MMRGRTLREANLWSDVAQKHETRRIRAGRSPASGGEVSDVAIRLSPKSQRFSSPLFGATAKLCRQPVSRLWRADLQPDGETMLEFDAALASARTMARIEEIAAGFWRLWGGGTVTDADAERIGARIEEARQRVRPHDTVAARAPDVPRAPSIFPPRKRRCVSPNRLASRERRRKLAYSGPLPPALASRFTTGQLAVLRIVADEVRAHGQCERTLGEIAARAGVGVTTARDAIRLAAGDGLVIIAERRRRGLPNLPNVVRIVSREWRAWIERARGGASKRTDPTEMSLHSRPSRASGVGVRRAEKRGDIPPDKPRANVLSL